MYSKVLFLAAFLALAYVASGKEIIRFAPEATEKINEAFDTCVANTPYKKEDLVNAFLKGVFPKDRAYKELMHCAFEKSGTLLDDGHVNLDVVLSLYPPEANVKDVITACAKENGSDKVETTFGFFTCTDEKSPVAIDFSL